mmetsp:Transcript_8130/g.28592  ORF Transcript_8130/g.28592 Transcript_8130/m.28592 type:complete len:578 (-) Transcript_8130:2-1735(-)
MLRAVCSTSWRRRSVDASGNVVLRRPRRCTAVAMLIASKSPPPSWKRRKTSAAVRLETSRELSSTAACRVDRRGPPRAASPKDSAKMFAAAWLALFAAAHASAARTPQQQMRERAQQMRDLVTAHIDSELEAYAPVSPTVAAVAEFITGDLTFWNPVRTVLILDGHVFVDKGFLERASKSFMHVAYLSSIQRNSFDWNKTAVPLNNVVYNYHMSSSGDPGDSAKASLYKSPPVVIAKIRGVAQQGIMIPNPYFGDGDLDTWGQDCAVFKRAAQVDWEKRAPRAFWRGGIVATKSCKANSGNYARLQALTLSLFNNNDVDVMCSSKGGCLSNTTQRCAQFEYDADLIFAQGHLDRLVDGNVLRELFAKNKYLLNLPGKTLGSYSRNLNHLWSLHSVVLLWRAAYSEWFYPALIEGETHLDVDYASLVATVRKLNDDAALVTRLREAALRVHDTLICPRCLAEHMSLVVEKFRERFSFGKVLDDPCETHVFFSNWTRCSKVNMVEIDLNFDLHDKGDRGGHPVAVGKHCDVLLRHTRERCCALPSDRRARFLGRVDCTAGADARMVDPYIRSKSTKKSS